jgi:hypothetical protein
MVNSSNMDYLLATKSSEEVNEVNERSTSRMLWVKLCSVDQIWTTVWLGKHEESMSMFR